MGIAGAIVMVLPLQAVGAAVRPSASVPSAAATVAAQDGCERVAARPSESSNGAATGLAVAECARGGVGMGLALPAIGVIVSAVLLAILIERGTGSGRGTGFSR
ncbi:MAG: hypothetical protein ABIR77_01130 [Sphingomicrobium sp.]